MSPLHSLKLCSTLTIEHTPTHFHLSDLSITVLCYLVCSASCTYSMREPGNKTKQSIAAQSILPHVGNRFYEAMLGVNPRTPLV